MPNRDPFGRTAINDALKLRIDDAFSAIPPGRRGALVLLATPEGATVHLAARYGTHWKVAAGSGWNWTGVKPDGYYASVEGSW